MGAWEPNDVYDNQTLTELGEVGQSKTGGSDLSIMLREIRDMK